jgi:drug/metabolite transporter (DMT)-like permease
MASLVADKTCGTISAAGRKETSGFEFVAAVHRVGDQLIEPKQGRTTSSYPHGALYGLLAVCIWAAFIVVSRLGVRTSLTPWDVAAIRFAVAGVLLLPYLLRRGLALDRLGWPGFAAIAVGCGAPMVLLVNAGLLFAPASHGGALFPGVMPLMVAILAAVILKEAFTLQKTGGLILIVLGAVGIV